jgi:hypothetical protein
MCCGLTGCQADDKPEKGASDNSPMFNKLHRESTMGALNAIRAAQISYMSQTGSYGTFTQLVNRNLLDSRFTGERPVVQGYAFTMSVDSSGGYYVNADPKEGEGRHFYMDQNNTIRYNDNRTASSSDAVSAGV